MLNQLIRCTRSLLRIEKFSNRRTPSRRIIEELEELKRLNRFDTKDHGGCILAIAPLGANVRHDYFAAPGDAKHCVIVATKVEFLEQNVLWKSHCSGIVTKYKKGTLEDLVLIVQFHSTN